jgi:hypothetical protein
MSHDKVGFLRMPMPVKYDICKQTDYFLSEISEFIVSLVLLTEIAIRISIDWRHFLNHKRNILDLTIALVTTVITIPGIGLSEVVCASLSLFQVLRIYRLVLAAPFTRTYAVRALSSNHFHFNAKANSFSTYSLATFATSPH